MEDIIKKINEFWEEKTNLERLLKEAGEINVALNRDLMKKEAKAKELRREITKAYYTIEDLEKKIKGYDEVIERQENEKSELLEKYNRLLNGGDEDRSLWVSRDEYETLMNNYQQKRLHINKLERIIKEKYTIFEKVEDAKVDAIRKLVYEMIEYAEKLPAEQNERALVVKDLLNTKVINGHIPREIFSGDLLERLNNLGRKPKTHIDRYYESGAYHNDHSKHINLGSDIDPNKLLE